MSVFRYSLLIRWRVVIKFGFVRQTAGFGLLVYRVVLLNSQFLPYHD